MLNFRMFKISDFPLWISTFLLILIGFFVIFSTTYTLPAKFGGDILFFVKRQFFSFLIGFFGLVVFASLDYRHLKKLAPYFYLLLLVLLVLVLFWGSGRSGAQRWFQVGILSFQPSEFLKMVIIVTLASYFDHRRKLTTFKEIFSLLFLVGLPFFLIFKQPDLGTALVVFIIFLGMLYGSGVSLQLFFFLVVPLLSLLLRPFLPLWIVYILFLAVALFLLRARSFDFLLVLGVSIGIGLAFPFFWGMLKSYQQQRILTFLNPETDPFGAGYHILQSKIAIGSGGFWGKGYLQGTQTQLHFIPEQHSDFIFSALGEEFGFLGGVLVLLLYAMVIWRIFVIASQSRDYLGNLLAQGIGIVFIFQVLANVGMTLSLLPVVGIPLPFLSYGGSSLLVNLISLGILQSIAMRRQKIIF